MANDNEDKAPPIIIIKRIKKAAHAHHGGAWKVAYADFVTAMMAFFLLLWLLQATTEEQKLGIADYFAPASVARNSSGSGGLLGGRTFTKKGANPHDYTPVGVIIKLPTNPPDWDNTGDPQENTATEETGAGGGDGDAPEQPNEAELEEILAEREAEQFAEAERALREAIESVPELESLVNNLVIDQTPEGMRIQIVDEEGKSMFPSGSAKMFEHTRKLITLVVDAVRTLPQRIAVKGHTDAAPFVNDNGYSNWELSTDRANSSRRALIAAGLRPARIASVVGLADTEHLDEDNPLSPRNRRISIVLLRENAFAPKAGKATKKQNAAAE
ncbi:MAG: flagellar motor protein MotB [Proteobacteria bacterium]|nr:flagellar motor protein MotB [Pseudomonadota bacterium]